MQSERVQKVLPSLEGTGEWRPLPFSIPHRPTNESPGSSEPPFEVREQIKRSVSGSVSIAIKFEFDKAPDEALVQTMRSIAAQLPNLVAGVRADRFNASVRSLAEAYLPYEALDRAYLALHEQQFAARQALLRTMPMLDAKAVARFAGHENRNQNQTAHRWKNSKWIFSVPVDIEQYPDFQFAHGRPKEIIHELLKILLAPKVPRPMTGWDLAFWFAGANSWLDGKTPLSLLDSEPQRLLEAARHAYDVISD